MGCRRRAGRHRLGRRGRLQPLDRVRPGRCRHSIIPRLPCLNPLDPCLPCLCPQSLLLQPNVQAELEACSAYMDANSAGQEACAAAAEMSSNGCTTECKNWWAGLPDSCMAIVKGMFSTQDAAGNTVDAKDFFETLCSGAGGATVVTPSTPDASGFNVTMEASRVGKRGGGVPGLQGPAAGTSATRAVPVSHTCPHRCSRSLLLSAGLLVHLRVQRHRGLCLDHAQCLAGLRRRRRPG